MRLTLLALLFAFVWGQDDERLDFSDATDRVESDEEVVEGTISLNGTVTPDSAGKLNWAAQNALIQACGSGSKVIAYTILQLTGTSERRGVDVKFFVLPRLGGGGDCARTLVEGSAGGFEPPFPPSGAKRKPIFRTMMETELDLLGFRDFLSDFYLRLWRVTCGTRPVWRNRISHSELNAVTVCSTYANGWEVYLEASLTEPATATGFFLGYSAGNADSGALQGFSDPCFVANSPCFCSSLANCGWRPREDGVGRQCRTLEAGDTQKPVACSHCQHQPGCPPSCAAESTACNCASIAATCHWDVETSECKEGGGSGVPCTSCSFQEKCDELRPRAEQFRPETIFAMSRVGPKSLIEVDFDMPLKLPGVAARGAARFLCGRDGLPPAANSLYLQEYVVPGDALLVEGRTLKLASGAVRVLEPTRCTVVFDDGVVQSAEGLPSKPVGFGEFYFNMKDSFPPEVAEFYPQNGAGDVPVTVPLLQVTFKERVRATEQFAAHLTHTDLFGSRKAAPKQLSLESVKERAVNLRLDGVLAPGRFYELTIDPGSIIDYGSLEYVGLSAGSYKFKTEGEFQEVQVIDGSMAYRLPGYAVAGIIVGSVLLVATGLFLCYRGYVAASEKDDVQAFEDEVGGASEDKRKQPVPIFHEDAIRDMQIDQLPETPDARKQGAILYAFEDEQQLEEGLKTKPQLLDAFERPARGHKPHSHLRPQPRPLSLKKAPEKEPPKLKPGFFLRDADT